MPNRPAVQFGDAGDCPVPADYNRDGLVDIAVYRPSTGMWFVRNQFAVQFGDPSDIPVPADYNGDGVVYIAVYRPSTGTWDVCNLLAVQFGDAGDIPVPADYNGDGITDLAVYRPSAGNVVRPQPARGAVRAIPATCPFPATTTATARQTSAVFRPSSTMWLVRNQLAVSFGTADDTLVPGDCTERRRADGHRRVPACDWHVAHPRRNAFGDSTATPATSRLEQRPGAFWEGRSAIAHPPPPALDVRLRARAIAALARTGSRRVGD